MFSKDLLSVIVTCYNRESSIAKCLESIRNQTYTNFEVIIIDDGSTDNSRAIIKPFLDDVRFHLIESTHIGFPYAKNLGLDNVHGVYVTFLDSDDIAYSYWLEMLYRTCLICNTDIAIGKYTMFMDQPAQERPYKEIFKHGLPMQEYSTLKMSLLYMPCYSSLLWNKLIKKELYDGIRFKNQMAWSDVSEMYKIFEKVDRIAVINLPLVHYRQHPKSMTECSKQAGRAYWKFRFEVCKTRLKYLYPKYPQSRYLMQLCLRQELQQIKKLFPNDYQNWIDISDILDILKDKPLPIILKGSI